MARMVVLGAGLALMAGAADAQMGPGAPYPMPRRQVVPGPGVNHPPLPPAPRADRAAPPRWGSKVGGRWWGGVNAPGGYASYRQPYRGYRVPGYWVAPRFSVADWSSYGLSQPPAGYGWSRYYDDAVLIDRGGSVYDYRSGLDWDGGYGDGTGDIVYHGDERRSDGVGGAVVGAAVGGVAGNLIAGRGNRLGGTLIGAGVGAATGYAIDRSRDGYDDGYRGPQPGYDDPRDVRRVIIRRRGSPAEYLSSDGGTTVTTVTSGTPVVIAPPAYGYGYGGGVTTITIQSQPVVTTTTTEVIEDSVTYTRPAVRTYRQRVYRARPKGKLLRRRPACGC